MQTSGQIIAQELGFTSAQIDVIRNTVAKDATDVELAMFLSLSKRYHLDPFAKEIWFIKYNNSPMIQTSRDGYLSVALKDPNYLGINSGTVRENDVFKIDWDNFKIFHEMNLKDRGNIVGAWAICKHKDREPIISWVPFDEYKKPEKDKFGKLTVWGQYPSAMIQKIAEVFALKRQFGISGLTTQEETLNENYQDKLRKEQRVKEEGTFVDKVINDIKNPFTNDIEYKINQILDEKLPAEYDFITLINVAKYIKDELNIQNNTEEYKTLQEIISLKNKQCTKLEQQN